MHVSGSPSDAAAGGTGLGRALRGVRPLPAKATAATDIVISVAVRIIGRFLCAGPAGTGIGACPLILANGGPPLAFRWNQVLRAIGALRHHRALPALGRARLADVPAEQDQPE